MKENKKIISLQVDEDLFNKIESKSKKVSTSKSNLIRLLLETYFESVYEEESEQQCDMDLHI